MSEDGSSPETVHPFRYSHVVGFDDFPFRREWRGNIPIVGVVYAGLRMEGVLSGAIRRDGANATAVLTRLVQQSKWVESIGLVLLQGVALGGFNVIDVQSLHRTLQVPVLVVARRAPNVPAVREALINHVRGGTRKWRLIESLGPMEPCAGVFVQRAGLTLADASQVITRYAVHGAVPEPLRAAHLIAGGIATGQSRGRT